MSRVGIIYLLHFDEPFSHARHYLGWTGGPLEVRLDTHLAGNGARLLAAVHSAGIGWRLARTWAGARSRERQIKRQGGLGRSCPLCGIQPASPAERAAVVALPARYPAYTGGTR